VFGERGQERALQRFRAVTSYNVLLKNLGARWTASERATGCASCATN